MVGALNLLTLQRIQACDRVARRSGLIFLARGWNRNTQSRDALGNGRIANCWNQKSVIL